MRQTAASVETAKEVKIFGLNRFLIDRYRRLAADFYARQPPARPATRAWGGLFTALGTAGYYFAYAYIVWRTLTGEFSSAISPSSPARSAACARCSRAC